VIINKNPRGRCIIKNIVTALDAKSLTIDDLRSRGSVGQAWSTGSRREKRHGMHLYIETSVGLVLDSVWLEAVKAIIIRDGMTELYNNFKAHYAKHKWADEKYILNCFSNRLYDDQEWVGFVAFNQQHRPEVLDDVFLLNVVCECCNLPGLITEAIYKTNKSENKCFCPVCGRYATMMSVGGYL
jgi:hypothetical protein